MEKPTLLRAPVKKTEAKDTRAGRVLQCPEGHSPSPPCKTAKAALTNLFRLQRDIQGRVSSIEIPRRTSTSTHPRCLPPVCYLEEVEWYPRSFPNRESNCTPFSPSPCSDRLDERSEGLGSILTRGNTNVASENSQRPHRLLRTMQSAA